SHIQYNRFWQKAIADDRSRFDHLTVLHDKVLKRQTILDQLRGKLADESKRASLLEQEKKLAETIHKESENISPAHFLKLLHPDAHNWIIEVPLYSDIEDSKFLDAFKKAVEGIWRVKEKKEI